MSLCDWQLLLLHFTTKLVAYTFFCTNPFGVYKRFKVEEENCHTVFCKSRVNENDNKVLKVVSALVFSSCFQ